MLKKIKISVSSTRKSKANHKFENNFKSLRGKHKNIFTCTKIYPVDAIPSESFLQPKKLVFEKETCMDNTCKVYNFS